MKKSKFATIIFFALGIFAGLYHRELKSFFDEGLRVASPQFLNWYLRSQKTADLAEALDASGQRVSQKLMDKHPRQSNYQLLRHIIGIEKWGQARLRVALGQPFVLDEYDNYRPEMGESWNELQDAFIATRAETLRLADEITENDSYHSYRILHNQFGEFSVDGWLYYLRMHAEGTLTLMR